MCLALGAFIELGTLAVWSVTLGCAQLVIDPWLRILFCRYFFFLLLSS
jgi:hypothetical protein